MFVSIPPKLSVSDFIRKVKGRSSFKVQQEFPELVTYRDAALQSALHKRPGTSILAGSLLVLEIDMQFWLGLLFSLAITFSAIVSTAHACGPADGRCWITDPCGGG